MKKIYVLFNPIAGNGGFEEKKETLKNTYADRELVFLDITAIEGYDALVKEMNAEDSIMLCGGDGTLNRFVNETHHLGIKNEILYYATGNGNDFLRDLDKPEGSEPFAINEYIDDLPTVTVNGKTHYFINGVGFGIDGYCCEVGDMLRAKGKTPNYTSIAIKGLLGGFKPTSGTVTVDGVTKSYKKIWIAPTMYGRFYGGGMEPAPGQTRNNAEGKVSFAAIHDSGKLRTLILFPSIFKGGHVKYAKNVDVISGHEVTVKFDRPTALQIDGETILGVTEYHVKSRSANSK